jgi:hypothetical protein
MAAMHPPWKTAKAIKDAHEMEEATMLLWKRVQITRAETHAFHARRALATACFQRKMQSDEKYNPSSTRVL